MINIFYVYDSLIFINNATKSSPFIILQVHSTCFGCKQHPSSGVHKTVTTASCTAHIFVLLAPSNVATLEGANCTKIWAVPEAVVTVLCTPDDGFGWYPKHVEWTCRIMNRLLFVASPCTVINIIWWTVLSMWRLSALEGVLFTNSPVVKN